jgi:hypothetical protein
MGCFRNQVCEPWLEMSWAESFGLILGFLNVTCGNQYFYTETA